MDHVNRAVVCCLARKCILENAAGAQCRRNNVSQSMRKKLEEEALHKHDTCSFIGKHYTMASVNPVALCQMEESEPDMFCSFQNGQIAGVFLKYDLETIGGYGTLVVKAATASVACSVAQLYTNQLN